MESLIYESLKQSPDILCLILSQEFVLEEVSNNVRHILGYDPIELQGFYFDGAKVPYSSYMREKKDGSLVRVECLLCAQNNIGRTGENKWVLLERVVKHVAKISAPQSSNGSSNGPFEYEDIKRDLAELEFQTFLAHEVRNPLSGIDSSILLVIENINNLVNFESDKRKRNEMLQAISDLNHVENCVTYIKKVLSNTLDITKLETGMMSFDKSDVNLKNEIILPAVKLIHSELAEGVQLKIICDDSHYVRVDKIYALQVMTNVLSNSFRYTKAGHIALSANLVVRQGQGAAFDMIQIRLEDTGVPIPNNRQMQLFHKYERFSSRQGDGLSLALSYQLMHALGGSILADSAYSTGGAFLINFPASQATVVHLHLRSNPTPIFVIGGHQGHSLGNANSSSELMSRESTAKTSGASSTDHFDLVHLAETGLGNSWVSIAASTVATATLAGVSSAVSGSSAATPGPSSSSTSGHHSKEISTEMLSYLNNLRILVVDDSKAATKFLLRRLQSVLQLSSGGTASSGANNFLDHMQVASTAEDALLILSEDPHFDVIIIDENMQPAGGEMLGHDAVLVMRDEYGMVNASIIGCTGNSDTCTQEFLDAGADVVWPKPLPATDVMILNIVKSRQKRLGYEISRIPGCKRSLLLSPKVDISSSTVNRALRVQLPQSWNVTTLDLGQVCHYMSGLNIDNGNHGNSPPHLSQASSVNLGHLVGAGECFLDDMDVIFLNDSFESDEAEKKAWEGEVSLVKTIQLLQKANYKGMVVIVCAQTIRLQSIQRRVAVDLGLLKPLVHGHLLANGILEYFEKSGINAVCASVKSSGSQIESETTPTAPPLLTSYELNKNIEFIIEADMSSGGRSSGPQFRRGRKYVESSSYSSPNVGSQFTHINSSISSPQSPVDGPTVKTHVDEVRLRVLQ